MSKQNVVITGASTGIGYSASKIFIENGCKVFGSVRKEADGEKLTRELGDNFIPLFFDVTNYSAIETEAKKVEKVIGNKGLACLINNAGIAVTGPLMHLSIDELRQQFEVNVFGLMAVTQAFLPMLGTKKDYGLPKGKIINISSVAGQTSMPFMGPYCGSKHALEGISNSLRRELLLYGIDVVIVAPGPVKTPIWKKGIIKEMPTEVLNSDYAPMLSWLMHEYKKEEKQAMEVDDLSREIYKIFKAKRPKTHYVFRNNKFIKWTLPRYILPDRVVDGFIKKLLKF
ncbi:MAG: short-subunit dehydrogenase [Cyclobacteriaceae bacterium]|jgi:short-subunit dehydrogenase